MVVLRWFVLKACYLVCREKELSDVEELVNDQKEIFASVPEKLAKIANIVYNAKFGIRHLTEKQNRIQYEVKETSTIVS